MNVPYRYRGLGLLVLLVVVLPWAAGRFALSDTLTAWRECRRLERRLASLAPTVAEHAPAATLAAAPELILSGGILDSLRRYAPAGIRVTDYAPVVTLRQEGLAVHSVQLSLTGSFADLLHTMDAIERLLPLCRLRSVVWQTTVEPRTRRMRLRLTTYIQQLTPKPEPK